MQMWARNMFGQKLSDDEMKDIPQSSLELTVHVTYKTIQAGSILGTFLTAPLATIVRAPRTLASLRQRVFRHSVIGCVVGAMVGPIMTYARIRNEPEHGIYDRSYRIRCNRNQVRVDQGSMLFGVGGGALGAVMGPGLISGGALGIAVGTLVAAGYNANHGDKYS